VGALLEPVGPLGAATYWRRRLVVIAVLLVALWLISRIGGDDESASAADQGDISVTEPDLPVPAMTPSPPVTGPDATDSAAATADPTPDAAGSPTGATQGVQVCSDGELSLAVVPSTARYAPDVKPTLALAVRTTGRAPCTRDLGPTEVALVITSGQDRIWASADCARPAPDVRVLTPGDPVTLQVTWARVRSTPGCPSAGATARPGTYVATPIAGEQTGRAASFLLD
jgi:hypothetical protein